MNKIIYSLKVMEELVNRGFIPYEIMPNPKNPRYNCWIFKVTEEFSVALDEVLGGYKNGRS